MVRTCSRLAFRLTLMVSLIGAVADADGAVSGNALPDLIADALKNNHGIKAAESRVKSLLSSPGRTWYLEPPEVGVEFRQAPVSSFPDPIKNQQEIDYSIRQTFPFPGKTSSRIEAAGKHAEMGESELEEAKRSIVRQVKMAYYELYLADRRMEINGSNQALIARFAEIARHRYEVGLGQQSDILRARTESTALKTDSIALAQSRQTTEGMLNALLDRGTERPLPEADPIVPGETDWSYGQLAPLAESNHPGLKAMDADIEMRRSERAMAAKEYWPDVTIGGSYQDMLRMPAGAHAGDSRDYWSVMVGMNVPIALWSLPKYKAGVLQSGASLDQAREEYREMRNMVFARARAALLKCQSDKELLRIARSVLAPQARQALESALTAYQGGKSEFTALLDAYRASLMARDNCEMAVTRLLSSQAELEEAVGLSLGEIKDRISEGAGK